MTEARDLRDPQKLGEKLLELRTALPNAPLSMMYDKHEKYLGVPNVSSDDSMGKACVVEYLAELKAGAEAGDRYSKAALDRLYSALPEDHPEHPEWNAT